MLNITEQIHPRTEHWRSSIMFGIGSQVSPSLTERCSDVIYDGNAASAEENNFKRLSAYRLLSGGLSTHLIADINRILLTIPAVVRETGPPKPYSQRKLSMKGKIWTKEKCPICNKSFRPSVDELTGDYLDLKCPDHHTRPRYVYVDAREFKVGRIYSDKRGNKFDSFLMAHRQLEAMRKAVDDHTFDPDDWSPKRLKEYNLKTLALKWLERLEKEKSYSHYKHCNTEMRLHIFPLLQDADVRDIRTKHVDELYEALIDKGLAPKSIKNCLTTLKIFLNKMSYKEIIKDLPKFPKFEVRPVKEKGWIGREKQQLILSHIPDREKIIFETLFETADRPGEVVAHKKKDLIEDECGLITERSLDARGKVKGEKSGKSILKRLSPELRDKLIEHSKNMLPEAWLFTNAKGQPYRQDNLYHIWKRGARKIGINISLYNGTRHSKASRRRQELQAEMDAKIAKEIGHDNPKTTKKHYILGKNKEL